MANNALLRISLLGGLGGMINAALCYFGWPVPVEGMAHSFSWHIVPAGFWHGALLAAIAALGFGLLVRLPPPARLLLLPPLGWIAGWLSWIAIDTTLTPMFNVRHTWWQHVLWPSGSLPEMALGLWQFFGLVAVLLCAGLLFLPHGARRTPATCIGLGIASGVLGSLWFWANIKPWYFSLLHGAIWGSLVGWGMVRSQEPRVEPPAAA